MPKNASKVVRRALLKALPFAATSLKENLQRLMRLGLQPVWWRGHRVLFFGQTPSAAKSGKEVSRKDAKIGARVAKKASEQNQILRVCFAGGILVIRRRRFKKTLASL